MIINCDKQKPKKETKKYLDEIRSHEVLGWTHCHKCGQSQNRFYFFYQEQFEEYKPTNCLDCNDILSVYCEGPGNSGPFSRPEEWRVPTRIEFEQKISELNDEFDTNLNIIDFRIDPKKENT